MVFSIALLIALVLSLIIYGIYQSIAKRVIKVREDSDEIIGLTGRVTEFICDIKPGKVMINGKTYLAKSLDDLEVGSVIKVLKYEGNKLVVTRNESLD